MYSLHPTMSGSLASQRIDELSGQARHRRRRQSQWETPSQRADTVAAGDSSRHGDHVEPGKPINRGPAEVRPQGRRLGPGRHRVTPGRPPSQAGDRRQCPSRAAGPRGVRPASRWRSDRKERQRRVRTLSSDGG